MEGLTEGGAETVAKSPACCVTLDILFQNKGVEQFVRILRSFPTLAFYGLISFFFKQNYFYLAFTF